MTIGFEVRELVPVGRAAALVERRLMSREIGAELPGRDFREAHADIAHYQAATVTLGRVMPTVRV